MLTSNALRSRWVEWNEFPEVEKINWGIAVEKWQMESNILDWWGFSHCTMCSFTDFDMSRIFADTDISVGNTIALQYRIFCWAIIVYENWWPMELWKSHPRAMMQNCLLLFVEFIRLQHHALSEHRWHSLSIARNSLQYSANIALWKLST